MKPRPARRNGVLPGLVVTFIACAGGAAPAIAQKPAEAALGEANPAPATDASVNLASSEHTVARAGDEVSSFRDVLELVARKNPRVVSAGYLVRAAGSDLAAARSTVRPQLSVDANVGWDSATSTTPAGFAALPEVRVSQLIFDGGRTAAEIRRRRIRIDLLNVQEQSTLADVSLQLALAWVDYSRAGELAAVAREQVEALSVLERLVRDIAQFDRGRASDVVMVDSRLEQARTTLETRQIAQVEARARIRQVAALPVDPQGPVPDIAAAIPATLEQCVALAVASPSVRLAELQVNESTEQVKANRNWWAPQVALEGVRTSELDAQGDMRLLNGTAARVRVSVVPFDSGGGLARYESAKANLAAAKASSDAAWMSASDEAARLWTFQAQRSARLASLSDLVGRADEARDIVFEQFRIGRRSILDVLSYDLERFNARAQLVNERFDIAQTRYQLMGTLGRIYQAVNDDAPTPRSVGLP